MYNTNCIKIYIHIIRDDDGNGGQPIQKVTYALNNLNFDFSPYNISFNWDLDEIHYINDGIDEDGNQGYYNVMHTAIFNDNNHYNGVDIYFFPDHATPWGGAANGVGQSSEIILGGTYNDGLTPVIDTSFITHEMGHVFGLWHTFHGTWLNSDENGGDPNPNGTCQENADGSNGEICGDYMSDTPADPYMNFNVDPVTCEWTMNASDDTGPYMPSTSNYMAYTDPNCMDNFTLKQVQRMKSLLNDTNILYLQAIQSDDCCAVEDLDLYIKDSVEDHGVEPNEVTEHMWESEDIWIRNINDDGLEHQNPIYIDENSINYIKVRVKNRSCDNSTGNDSLIINWAKANTALLYPENWDGSLFINGDTPLGGLLESVAIPVVNENSDTIITIPWEVPNPDDYTDIDNEWHFCLLATIISTDDPLTIDYTDNPNDMVRSNNNQAWKNITVVDMEDGLTSGTVMVGNTSNYQRAFTLEFEVESSELGKAIYDEAEVSVEMDDALYAIWERGGKQQTLLMATRKEETRLISDNGARLDNLIFNAKERALLTLNFNMLVKEQTPKNEYTIRVIQKDANTNEVIGGETYKVFKEIRETFSAAAGNDEEIDADETVTITPEQINEAATYNWYDPEGNLIHQGTSLTVTADMAKKFTLEVIADEDGYKDYDEVEVTLKPSRITSVSPNPVTQNLVQINYKLNNVTSAYLMVVDQQSGVSQNYILDPATNSTSLDLNNYIAGQYTVALVCDSEITDAKNFIKQ